MRNRKRFSLPGFLVAPALLAILVAGCAVPAPSPADLSPDASLPEETGPAAGLPETLPLQPPPDPDRLLGLEPRQVQDVLGTPNLVRRENAAQVMQFKNGNCVLDVIFYEEAAGGAFRARHLASRMVDGAAITAPDCLAAILPDGRYPAEFLPPADVAERSAPEIVPETGREN